MTNIEVDSLDAIKTRVHALAKEKGWHEDTTETRGQFIERTCNNLHNEVSELHEAYRNGQLDAPCDKAVKMREAGIVPITCLEEELADIIIRVLDSAARLNVDIATAVERKHAFNATRAYRHGGKLS